MLRRRIVNGAVSGFIATGPMTVVMIWLFRFLPWRERADLPPRQLTRKFVDSTGAEEGVGDTGMTILTVAGHFGYGAAGGALLAMVRRFMPLPAPVSGILFGLFIWTGSYLGWIPAARLLPPATESPQRRNLLMIAAHVVWGAAAGSVLDHIEHGSKNSGFGQNSTDQGKRR